MMTMLPADRRGHTKIDWLDSRHSFSFGEFYNPRQMGFRALRVINEDRVLPGRGFGTHPHRDMEIVTYVLEGGLQHRDSLGTGSVIRPGDVQRMSAGTGVLHSEFNASKEELVHFLQIWVLPDREGLPPGYEQKTFPASERQGRLRLVASPDGREGSLTIHQDAAIHAGTFAKGDAVTQEIPRGRHAWLQLVRGALQVNGTAVRPGDGLAVSDEAQLRLEAVEPSELLLFDLA